MKYREKMLGRKPSIGEQRSVIRPSNKLMETKFGDNWLVELAIELQGKLQGEGCIKNQREEIRRAPREELESFLERKGRKLSELSARELEDYVKKRRKVYVRQLKSPSVEEMTG